VLAIASASVLGAGIVIGLFYGVIMAIMWSRFNRNLKIWIDIYMDLAKNEILCI
jgi:hypothetical protein